MANNASENGAITKIQAEAGAMGAAILDSTIS